MNIEKQHLDDHQVRLTVEIDNQPFEDAKRRAAKKIARQIKIPGFRPGKAPYAVIARSVGEPAIIEEAIEILVDDMYPKIIDEAELEPYGPGALEEIASLEPLTLKFMVPLRASVELSDYKAIQKDYELPTVTEEQVDEVIQNLRERQAVVESAERAAQESDLVNIRMSADLVEPVEDEDGTIIEERSYPVVIEAEDADTTDEWPFAGFSRQLIGLSIGDEKILEQSFPEDAPYEQFAGKNVKFSLNVENVQSRTLPELDDEFAQSFGDFETMDALRSTIRENLEEESSDNYNEAYDDDILGQIVGESTIKYPPQMLETEIDNVIDRLANTLARQGMDVDLYLKTREMDMAALREEMKPVAVERIKKSLSLLEIADAEGLRVTPEELEAETNRTLGELMQYMSEKEFKDYLSQRDSTQNLVGNLMMDMLIHKTRDRLRNIAQGIEEPEVADETDTQAESEAELEVETEGNLEAEPIAEIEPQVEPEAVESETLSEDPASESVGAGEVVAEEQDLEVAEAEDTSKE